MKQSLQFDFEWLASNLPDSSARALMAALSIRVNGKPATELEDVFAKTVRDAVRVSVHDLALWLAANWWRLRWEPQRETLSWKMSHYIGAVGGGYAWPSLSFAGDGDFMLITGRPSSDWNGAPVRYLRTFEEIIGATEFEQGVDCYIEAVLDRMASFGRMESILPDLWSTIREERQMPEQATWRKLEALLGYEPDEAPTGMIETLQGMENDAGRGAIEEIASASQSRAMNDLSALLAHRNEATPILIPGRDSLRQKIEALDPTRLPWQRAECAAGLVREEWGISLDNPISSKELCDRLGIATSFLLGGGNVVNVPMTTGFRGEGAHGEVKVLPTKRQTTGRRFDLGRLIGDDLSAHAGESLLPATPAKTSRQKFQRAFAQELLCPFAALNARYGDEADDDAAIEDAAAYFDVSPLLVKTAFVNRGRLPRDENRGLIFPEAVQ